MPLANRRAQEHADKLRCAIEAMRSHKRALEGLGYTVIIDGGAVSVTRKVEEAL